MFELPRRTPLQLHSGQRRPRLPNSTQRPDRPEGDKSPLGSVQALAGAMFVASMAACWIAVATTASAPLLAAGELLSRAAREPQKLN